MIIPQCLLRRFPLYNRCNFTKADQRCWARIKRTSLDAHAMLTLALNIVRRSYWADCGARPRCGFILILPIASYCHTEYLLDIYSERRITTPITMLRLSTVPMSHTVLACYLSHGITMTWLCDDPFREEKKTELLPDITAFTRAY